MYYHDCVRHRVPRDLVVQDVDARGRPAGNPYRPEQEYLQHHAWEDSPTYCSLVAGTTAGTLNDDMFNEMVEYDLDEDSS